jgi:outer membrane protein OmpA-like peptidoglycan-associated protein/tetratricopeptide (TPR) repeat protein
MNRVMNTFYCSLFALLIGGSLFAQEEAEACMEPSKKVLKYLKSAQSAKSEREAVENFSKAIEEDEENAMAYYEFAMFAYNRAIEAYDRDPNPESGDRLFAKAEKLFKETLELCHDYHSNCTYYLGIIRYSQGDMEGATKWFKAFQAYNHEDASKYADDHTKRLQDVKEVVGELEYVNEVTTTEVPFDPKIVRNVSSATHEYFPMISPDNELIFYSRMVEKEVTSFNKVNIEEFTFSHRPDYKSEFDTGKPLPPPFNDGSVKSYGASTLSVDNKEMIICACKDEKVNGMDYRNCDLYSTTYVRSGAGGNDYTWTPLERLGDEINTPTGWEGQPSLSADGRTLYFTANRPTTRDNDIFVAKRKPDGTWGQAKPFDLINTDGKDKSPFLHQDSETLYFVSQSTKKRVGVGGLDIFYIRQNPDGSWTEPKNIGYPINSEEDELGLFVSIDGQIAYFSSAKGGNWDIYSFELYEDARPQSVALLKGELKNESGEPVADATIEIAYEGSDEVTEVKVNGDDGHYAAIVKTSKKQDVMVTVKKEGHAFDSKLIEKEDFKEDNVTITGKDLEVKKLKVGEAYTINDILYRTNSAALSDRSKFILKGFARFLKENESISVSIQGHTDDKGDDADNFKLSQDRADGVREFLISQGIDKKRLDSKGFGETKPKVKNDSEANRALNRRTEFVITRM